ncbi:hypothetical protein PGB90_006330 [Kerria lacca]
MLNSFVKKEEQARQYCLTVQNKKKLKKNWKVQCMKSGLKNKWSGFVLLDEDCLNKSSKLKVLAV